MSQKCYRPGEIIVELIESMRLLFWSGRGLRLAGGYLFD